MITPGVVLILLAAVCVWLLRSGRPKKGFLPDFAKVLEHPEFVESDDIRRRSFLKGEFRGRKVVVMLQLGWQRWQPMVVVSMETQVEAVVESAALTGFRDDREGELALLFEIRDSQLPTRVVASDGLSDGQTSSVRLASARSRLEPST
jgi:hypothetical protein